MAKQSGPPVRVKGGSATSPIAIALIITLSGCASGAARWSQQGHTTAITSKDLAKCETSAERATLSNMGQTRGAYGADNAPGVAGGSRNQNPMKLHDRADAADQFRDSVARCMTGLGYADARAPITSRRR